LAIPAITNKALTSRGAERQSRSVNGIKRGDG
jgi:hypothetical protein